MALFALALAGCGGGGGGGTTPSATAVSPGGGNSVSSFQQAAPSFNDVSMQVEATDTTPSSWSDPSVTIMSLTPQDTQDTTCHPHLFKLAHGIVLTLNKHTSEILNYVELAISASPSLDSGASKTFTTTTGSVVANFILTHNADGSYSYELDLAPSPPGTVFTKVFTGTVTRTSPGSTGTMNFDYSALSSVIGKDEGSGQVSIAFTNTVNASEPAPGLKKNLVVTLTNFIKAGGDAHGPRTGVYTHLGEPNVGGYLVFGDTLDLVCSYKGNPLPSTATNESRWYVASDGVHGRSDAKAVGGGEVLPGYTLLGLDCYDSPIGEGKSYWQVKLEDSTGAPATYWDWSSAPPAAACDAGFGAIPSPANSATDWTFGNTLTFPNEW
jgi:hypothetical protein